MPLRSMVLDSQSWRVQHRSTSSGRGVRSQSVAEQALSAPTRLSQVYYQWSFMQYTNHSHYTLKMLL
jgi:hypothetical protein